MDKTTLKARNSLRIGGNIFKERRLEDIDLSGKKAEFNMGCNVY